MRRAVGVCLALATALLAVWWMIEAGTFISRYIAFSHLNQGGPLSQATGPRPDAYDRAAYPFYLVLLLAPIIGAAGFAYCLLFDFALKTRSFVYAVVLAILLPLNLFNYGQGDVVLGAPLQAVVNMATIFCGLVIVAVTWTMDVSAVDARIAKALAIVLILASAVLAPALYTAVWAMYAIGMIDKSAADQVTWQHITAVAGIASSVITILKFLYDVRKDARALETPSR
ncbi:MULTISPECIES: hypothetical protein [unclassified Ensifer]|uniref:hypothetical protein n=1 Tax=unclassified Ensifer TaxID=2633371 RepID=UPI000812C566|nr:MULTISPECIES: hypothetical protein [unclassified Ensifer]OCO98980.1 hypothetical protein BC362_27490 [Ensifer sp. LC14]OCP11400.1 hypothetical protein BC374_17180 [Ensifer sp. LC13]OCP33467.1 hypothetical protein BC364_16035 [Ensifer sp. LC499]